MFELIPWVLLGTYIQAGHDVYFTRDNMVAVAGNVSVAEVKVGYIDGDQDTFFGQIGVRMGSPFLSVFVGGNVHESGRVIDSKASFAFSVDLCHTVCVGFEHYSNGHGTMFKQTKSNVAYNFITVKFPF